MEIDAIVAGAARSLRSSENIAERGKLLAEAHMAALARFVTELRVAEPSKEFPDFDPLDGGTGADILFLFEKPGPMTSAAGFGSGFISRDNDDPTAEATFGFMIQAGLPRRRTITWNVIPGWNGTRKVTAQELHDGVASLAELLQLLPRLRTVVLVGKRAERAKSLIEHLKLRVLVSAHPSPLVRASRPDVWRAIPILWAQAGTS